MPPPTCSPPPRRTRGAWCASRRRPPRRSTASARPISWWAFPASPYVHPRREGSRGCPRSSAPTRRRSWRCARTSSSASPICRRTSRGISCAAAAVGRAEAGSALADDLAAGLSRVADAASSLPRRPRAFFEEWPEPLISGIRWVSELVELCGGEDVCAESRSSHAASGRIFEPSEVARRDPEVVLASWCGKKARREVIAARPGFAATRAVRDDQLYEVKSAVILQPGPAALTDGAAQLAAILAAVARGEKLAPRRGGELRSADAAPGA